ncbi:Uncharacterised protein [Mycobacteroides abscessus]|nr:Uncharacterised protein [Mycobacteroides abscessus]
MGRPTTRSPSIASTAARRACVARTHRAVRAVYPAVPSAWLTAHAAASGAAERDPDSVGLTTGYPGQPVVAKNWRRWRSRPRTSRTDAPLGA